MAKIYTAEKNAEALEKLYNKRIVDGDYIGAVNVLNSLASISFNLVKLFEYYAKTYFYLEQYEKSAEYWFKYLTAIENTKSTSVNDLFNSENEEQTVQKNYLKKDNRALAYAGLGSDFYKSNNISLASYYFKYYVSNSKTVAVDYVATFKDFLSSYTKIDKNYYLVYPYKDADFTKLIEKAEETYRIGKYEDAISELEVIPKESKFYSKKLILTALCKYFLNDNDGAVADFDKVVKLDGDNPTVLCNAISVYNKLGLTKKTKKCLDKLKKIKLSTDDETYKYIMVLTEVGEEDLALSLGEKYLKSNPYNTSVMLIMGQIYYNKGNFKLSYDYFHRYTQITNDWIGRNYRSLANNALLGKKKVEVIDYNFDVSYDTFIKVAKSVSKLVDELENGKLDKDGEDFALYLAEYVYGKCSYNNYAMQIRLLEVLNAYQTEKTKAYVLDLLLKFNVYDVIKMQIIEDVILSGYFGEISVVVSNVYKRFKIYNVPYKTESDFALLKAYAKCFSKVVPVEEYPDSLDDAIKKLNKAYNEVKKLKIDFNEIIDLNSLAAVLYEHSKIKTIKNRKGFAQYFNTTLKEIKKIKELLSVAPEKSLIEIIDSGDDLPT